MTMTIAFQRPRRASRALLAAGLATLFAAGAAAQQHAHVHGRAELNVAVDAQTVTVQLESPLDSLLGFERAPRTDAERKRVADAVKRLQAADKLFRVDPAGQCTLKTVELESEVLGLGKDAAAAPQAAAKGHDKHDHKDGHDDEHADIDVTAVFGCANAAKARFIDVGLFEAFPRYKAIDAQVAAPGGQSKRTLTKAAPRLAW